MPIEVHCDSCKRKLRVPDTAAGKRIKCPKCQGVISVPSGSAPGGGGSSGSGSNLSSSSSSVPVGRSAAHKSSPRVASPLASASTSAEQWYVQTEEGQQYGPVTRSELNQWHREGRITAETQLLLEGAPQWQWAPDVFPDLNTTQQPQSPQPAATQPFAQQPAADDPAAMFAALSGKQPAATAAPSDIFAGVPAQPAASSSGPFDFGASPASSSGSHAAVSSRGKSKGKRGRGGKKGGSEQIDYLAYAMYGLGGLTALGGIVAMIMGLTGAAAISASRADGAAAVAGVWGTILVVAGLFSLLFAVAYGFVGYGLQQRAAWARITALVIGGLSLLSFPIGTLIGVWAFMVLLDKDNAAAFG
jgi:hypothetical protein